MSIRYRRVNRLKRGKPSEQYKRLRLVSDLLLNFNSQCVYCGVRLFPATCTVDHWIPRSKGGSSHFDNFVPSCRSCNEAKADVMPINFVFQRA